jgi:hypothetical protein
MTQIETKTKKLLKSQTKQGKEKSSGKRGAYRNVKRGEPGH